MTVELHWKEGELAVIGVPPGYRYLLGEGKIENGVVAPDQIVVNKRQQSGVLEPIRLPLKEGEFLFRARNKYGQNYEYEGSTGRLPLRVFDTKRFSYQQMKCVEGLDEFPDPRNEWVER